MKGLRQGLEALELQITEMQLSQLTRYLEEIERWNLRQNLVRASGADLVTRHLLDSLAGASGGRAPGSPAGTEAALRPPERPAGAGLVDGGRGG